MVQHWKPIVEALSNYREPFETGILLVLVLNICKLRDCLSLAESLLKQFKLQ